MSTPTTRARNHRGRHAAASAVAILAAASLAACGGTTTKPNASGKSVKTGSANTTLEVTTGSTGNFVDNFNPFSGSAEDPTRGMIYEPLYFFDTADAARKSPWLATSYAFSNGGKALTFQLRHGVKWSDGTPFTSADVAFTFNLIRSNPALNGFALPITGVTTSGTYSVTVDFSKPAYSDLNYAAGLTYILPEHIWKNVKNPTTFLNSNPVGTGAWEVASVSAEVMNFKANPNYYMAGLPKFKKMQFLSFKSNTSTDLAIENGTIDWGGGYIPNIKVNYLDKSSHFALSDIPLSTEFLVPNMKSGPTASLAVRQALSDAVNRSFVSNTVYQGYASPSNPMGLLTPNFSNVLDPALKSAKLTYSVSAAKKTLEAAGYKLGSNGMFSSASGKPLTVTCQVISGYTDYVQSLQIIAQEMKAAGINFVVSTESYAQFTANQDTGNFQLLIDNFGYTPIPYVYYNDLLNGAVAPAIGKSDTVGNYGRYNNPTVNAALNAIGAAKNTSSVLSDYYTIEKQFIKTEPLIPLFDQQDEQEFNTKVVTGFPTVSNPYAADAIYEAPDLGWVAARLTPAS